MPSPAAITIYAFGITALLAGISSLVDPASLASQLNFPLACTPVARGNALAAIAMGLYYSLAAYQENTTFFIATVPMRLLTTTVFFSQGWTVPAVWEGAGAVVTGAALLLASGTGAASRKKSKI
ncbi:putative mfs multidrug protein [Rosellinia necatrix]|uniref:Putative mfs multidrug protein n=1 Tax=Rosellinia necatrix TaxID=77044 RepID=A0A1S8A541_ROSNE|nr:putative mfs multidrug protein [Rosellinia necatrix]